MREYKSILVALSFDTFLSVLITPFCCGDYFHDLYEYVKRSDKTASINISVNSCRDL